MITGFRHPSPARQQRLLSALYGATYRNRLIEQLEGNHGLGQAFSGCGTLPAAVEKAQRQLAGNPGLASMLDQLGRERALLIKVVVLTGLRKSELGSLTVGQVVLDSEMPCLILDATDEKNGKGSIIPLRSDLVEELREWILEGEKSSAGAARKLFSVPTGLVRILDRDLQTAGIPKRDDRGRTIDVHALRTTFGTLLSAGGVSPRTAQAAMRHSSIDLTMNTYTDPKLLGVQGAVHSLPSLKLPATRSCRRTEVVAPDVAPVPGHSGQTES